MLWGEKDHHLEPERRLGWRKQAEKGVWKAGQWAKEDETTQNKPASHSLVLVALGESNTQGGVPCRATTGWKGVSHAGGKVHSKGKWLAGEKPEPEVTDKIVTH